MLKKLSTVLIMFVLFTMVAKAQWTFQGAWPDTGLVGGTHGIVVDPDGKVWTASFFSLKRTDGSDTLNYYPLFVYNADGTLANTIYTVTDGTVTDSLADPMRGLATDHNGNILYAHSTPNKMIRINYQTYARMGSVELPELGSSPTKPAVSSDGTIFVGPVVGGDPKVIAMYDPDLAYIGNAVVGPPAIARTMEVSPDGLTIYWTPFTGGQMYIYTRQDQFSEFTLADTVLQGMSIESVAWNPATGHLWVSHDSRGTGPYTHLTWYAYDTATKTLVDSFSMPPVGNPDEYPRAIDFTADGNTAYVGLFGSSYAKAYKFTKSGVGIQKDNDLVVSDYSLSQNYPNPFNPSTEISFTVVNPGFVSLKVYDILGKEVATLVNEELANGGYKTMFDASNLASGTYVYRLSVNGVVLSKKMSLMK